MAKGDDAVMRKRNRVKRKRMRSNESSSLSARVASIIASKRRRKAGKRRMCEGMCFSLPTPEDPFNDRQNNKQQQQQQHLDNGKKPMNDKKKRPPLSLQKNITDPPIAKKHKGRARDRDREGDFEVGCLSKFVILCLNAIQKQNNNNNNTCKEVDDDDEEEEEKEEDRALLASSWGADFWRHCLAGSDILDTSGGASANREQLAWLLSTASDLITRKEKQGALVPSPFLLYLVPCQQKSIQVRSMCKPLKDLGLHSVSLHPGVSIDHQIHGLKSCEPEFLISTPERLLELLSLRAIDISGVSLMVLDGLKSFVDFGFSDKVKSIRENISGQPQVVIFSDCYEDLSTSLVQSLLKGRVHKLSLDDSIASKRAFISQSVHLLGSEEKNISKVGQRLYH